LGTGGAGAGCGDAEETELVEAALTLEDGAAGSATDAEESLTEAEEDAAEDAAAAGGAETAGG
jgi:hypothetical protein